MKPGPGRERYGMGFTARGLGSRAAGGMHFSYFVEIILQSNCDFLAALNRDVFI